jgi:hypothetical protein
MAASTTPQSVRSCNHRRGRFVVSCACRLSHGRRQPDQKHQQEASVWTDTTREILLQFFYENAGLEALYFQGRLSTQSKIAIYFFQTAPTKLLSEDQKANPSRYRHPLCPKCPEGLAWAGSPNYWHI